MIYQNTIINGDKQLTLNCSDLNCNWILIYNQDLFLFLDNIKGKKGKLETCNSIFEASTKEECLAEIKKLRLKVEDEDIAADLKLLETPIVKKETNTPLNLLDRLKSLSATKL